ncbi:Beta-glucosidase 44 [Capsicum annuum]|uniref:Beta-glucosidase 44 n=1 Tax=Capsicum annuum TaxID=4072 RepID=A0A2G3A337_CAPAN|nr:Beta-glucosidase 44 [Capsicum annuum]
MMNGGLLRRSFPKGFVFGTATSAYQVEGAASIEGRGPSIWDTFIKQPGIVPNNVTGEVSVDQYHRYKEDINLMAWMNFDAYRFSISWSRIFPSNLSTLSSTPKFNLSDFARIRLSKLLTGITPYVNLSHYDLPQALQDRYNGWLGREVVKDFADYADFCFKMFGDRVKNWFSFNEPRVIAALGYDTGNFAPGRCSKPFGNCTDGDSATEPYIVAHNLILCHASAAQRYREKYSSKTERKIWHSLGFCVGLFFKFLHPLVYSEYPKTMINVVGKRLPKFTEEEVKMVKGSMDYLGINQYTAYYMYDPHHTTPQTLGYQQDWNVGFAYDRKGVPIGDRVSIR